MSTLELFEEIMLTAGAKPAKYKRMRKMWRLLVSHRVLLPMNLRHRSELEHGGVVPEPDRYLPAEVRRAVIEVASVRPAVGEINQKVYEIKRSKYGDDASAKVAVLAEIDTIGAKRKHISRDVQVSTVDEWAADVVAAGEERGLPPFTGEASLQHVPSAWLMCAATIARSVRVVRENRGVKDSDNHDRHHTAASAYFDVLVTEDVEFSETLRLIPKLPCEVMSAGEFDDWLRNPP